MGTKRGTREVPAEHREALAANVEAWIAAKGPGRKTEREVAPVLGISQASLNEIRNKRGPLGLHVLLALRTALRMSIDQMLGLSDLTVPPPPVVPDDLEGIRRVLREELAAIRAEEKEPEHAKPLRGRPTVRRGLHE